MCRDAAGMEHLVQMAEQAESCDVCRALAPCLDHRISGILIQGLHVPRGDFDHLLRRPPRLDGCRDDARAERLREHEPVAGLSASLERYLFWMHRAGNGHSVLGLTVIDGVAADD